MVLQDTNLFSGTVMDNIRYGRLDATDEECINAARENEIGRRYVVNTRDIYHYETEERI